MQRNIRNLKDIKKGDFLTFVSARPVNLVDLIQGELADDSRIMEELEITQTSGNRIAGVIRSGKRDDHRSRPIHFSRTQGIDPETKGIIINKRFRTGYEFLLETLRQLVELQYSSGNDDSGAKPMVVSKLS